MDKIDHLLTHNIDSIYPSKEALHKKLSGQDKLRIYFGVDPTNPNIHIGNAVPLWKLREFQDLGHHVIFLIGDFTGLIGDPSGKDITRPVLSKEEIAKNAKTYVDQARKILDFEAKKKPEILYNSEWNSKLKFADVIKLASEFSVQQMLERDMFQERLKSGASISAHELLYPIVQGYDSVMMNVDIELGGTDQTFNMLVGREMVKRHLNKEKFVLTSPLLPGNDGRKMSKSYGNVINITDAPNDMFGKAMTVDDELLEMYLEMTTTLTRGEVKFALKKGPFEAKKNLGFELVKRYYNETDANKAQGEFENTFSKGQLPSEITTYVLNKSEKKKTIIEFLVDENIASSNSDARRLVDQGGVTIIEPETLAEQKLENSYQPLVDMIGKVLKVRRNWIRIVDKV